MYIYLRNLFRKIYVYAENLYISSQINRHIYVFCIYYYTAISNYHLHDRNTNRNTNVTREIEMV